MQAVVSIIVPCFNYGHFLAECLNSVLNQTYPHWECLIIDNGSTDNTAELSKQFATKDQRIKYLFTEQKGVSFARNAGIKQSVGKYILPLDADDRLEASYVEKAVAVISKNPDIKVVYCDAERFGAFTGKWVLPEFSLKHLLVENTIFCTALFRRADFNASKGFNENMRDGFEDWDFWIELLKNGGRVYKIPEVLFYYRMRVDSRNGQLDEEKQLRLRKQIFKNHQEVYESHFSIPELIFRNYLTNNALEAEKKSMDKRLGAMLLKPLRVIKALFKSPKK